MTEPAAIVKRKVTMVSVVAGPDDSVQRHEAIDYVPEDLLDAYVADAKERWQYVEVGDVDSGPGGDGGATYYPDHLDHPMAGTTLPADNEPANDVAPAGSDEVS